MNESMHTTHDAGARRIRGKRALAFCCGVLLGAIVLPGSTAEAGTPQLELVKDIDTTPDTIGSQPAQFRAIDGKVYFNAALPASGTELHVSDGVSARLLADLAPGPASSRAVAVGHAGGRLVVTAESTSGEYVASVNETDGSAIRLLTLGQSWPAYGRTRALGAIGNRLLFAVSDARILWGTDGTPAGTMPLFAQQVDTAVADRVCRLPQRAVLLVSASGGGYAFWRTDGTAAGTVSFATVAGDADWRGVATTGSHCYFLIDKYPGWQLWRTDGISANLAAASSAAGGLALGVVGSVVYIADTTGSRLRLWRTDRPQPFVDVTRGTNPLDRLYVLGDKLVFGAAVEGSPGQAAFYLTDGTSAGTQRLTPSAAMPQTIFPPYQRPVGRALLVGDAGGTWRIDADTAQVTALGYGLDMLTSGDAAELGGALIGAQAESPSTIQREVWRSDGTPAGTRLLHDLRTATRGALADLNGPALGFGDVLLFSEVIDRPLEHPLGRRALWRTDGSAAGTREVPRSLYGEGSVTNMVDAVDAVVVRTTVDGAASDAYRIDAGFATGHPIAAGSLSRGLHRVKGVGALLSCTTAQGSRDLCAIRAGEAQAALIAPNLETLGGAVEHIGSVGGALLFYLGLPEQGMRGLWRSDGTAPGTYRLRPDLVRGSNLATASMLIGGQLLFDGRPASQGAPGLYASDATTAGTELVTSLPAHAVGLQRWHDGRAVFLTDTDPTQLWFSDGTGPGTASVLTLPTNAISVVRRAGGWLHVIGSRPGGALDYYVTDGTAQGTRAVTTEQVPETTFLAMLDERTVLFRCRSASIGSELCAVDANGDNARLLRDIYPGPDSSDPRLIGSTATATYLAANDGMHGRELWRVIASPDRISAHDFEVAVTP